MTHPQEPRWGDPQSPPLPPADPRSPEWRDPAAQPWWGERHQPPPPAFSAPPPPGSPRGKLAVIVGIAALLVLVLGVSLVASHGSSSPRLVVGPDPLASVFPNGGPIASDPPDLDPAPSVAPPIGDPVSTTKAYYGDLAADRASDAWDLLCDARQQAMPLAGYKASYAQDVATGTGIKTFTQSGAVQLSGDGAAVPGTLVLADHESVPITVLLLQEASGWRVCSSDLGGVLPNPGSSSGGVTT